jgi:hypothetical protein
MDLAALSLVLASSASGGERQERRAWGGQGLPMRLDLDGRQRGARLNGRWAKPSGQVSKQWSLRQSNASLPALGI